MVAAINPETTPSGVGFGTSAGMVGESVGSGVLEEAWPLAGGSMTGNVKMAATSITRKILLKLLMLSSLTVCNRKILS